MNFVTTVFIVFLVIVYLVWRLLPYKSSKVWLCVSSLFFYGYWFPPFLILLFTSGLIDYFAAIKIENNPEQKKKFLILSMTANLVILFTFKYFNFFQNILIFTSAKMGVHLTAYHLDFILPMGISFYTFQSMSYTIDVYRKELKPADTLLDFFLYLSFFPQLVAGPIVRAVDFMPQMNEKKTKVDWEFILYRLSRGFFLKVVITDNIASSVNYIFSLPGAELTVLGTWLGAVTFAIQIFCDFSGYSDIAIACACLFGYHLNENFNFPYLSKSLTEFWSRWHISLSTWFRDYLYIPIGGNRGTKLQTALNLLFVFLVSGLWHGAKMTFVFWGFIHGIGLLAEKYLYPGFVKKTKTSGVFSFFGLATTLFLVILAWVPFRAMGTSHTMTYWKSMFIGNLGSTSGFNFTLFFIFLFLISHGLTFLSERKPIFRYLEIPVYFLFILLFPGTTSDFIYFQF